MKISLEAVLLDSAGSVIALVQPPAERALRAAAARALRRDMPQIERAAFLTEPRQGEDVRVEPPDGAFDADVLRCAGYAQALWRGETGKCLVMAACGGLSEALPVVADPAQGTASAVMPLPEDARALPWAYRAAFAGGVWYVIEDGADEALLRRAVQAEPDAPLVGAAFFGRGTGAIRPVVFLRASGEYRELRSSAAGSAAAAMMRASELRDGITEIGVGQRGGNLEVGVRTEGGRVTGLSVGGPVRQLETVRFFVDEEPDGRENV